MAETGATAAQIEAAVLAFIDEWNADINPRTGRRYRAGSWSTRLWFQYMRAALGAVIQPGYRIVGADAVVLTPEQAATARKACIEVADNLDAYPGEQADAVLAAQYRALAEVLGGG